MDLMALICERLCSNENLAGMLAKHGGEPAVFAEECPPDQDSGWSGKSQYPRICYRADMQIDKKRNSSGTLHIAVYTTKESLVIEQIESEIKRCLKDVLMKPDDQAPFCVSWARTEPYMLTGAEVIWKEITFDIIQYPGQETTDPDPVLALCRYIKELYQDSVVMGLDRIGQFTDSSERPIFYVELRKQNTTTGHCMNTIAWFECVLSVHILYPDDDPRLKMAAGITQRLRVDEEVIMFDQSPMTIKALSLDNSADYMRDGQLSVTAKYGCLRGLALGKNATQINILSDMPI